MRKYWKPLSAAGLVLVATLSWAVLPGLAQNRMARRGPLQQLMQGMVFLQSLDLTEQQKGQIRGVLAGHKNDISAAIKEYVEARMALNTAIHDNGNVERAFQRVINAERQGLELRLKIRPQILPILAPAQIQKLDAKRQDVEMHVTEWLKHLDTILGNL